MPTTGVLGCAGGIVTESSLVIYAYPNDRRLAVLPRLVDPPRRERLFRRLLPNRPDRWPAEPQRLRYKPERRLVARLASSGDQDALLRAYNEADYASARRSAGAFSSGRVLRVASKLAQDDGRRTLILEWLPGQPLDK